MEGDGATAFCHAKLGLEGIASKRKDSAYRSGRSPDWLKMGQEETVVMGKNRIMIYGPKNDGTYIVEFKTTAGEALTISVPEPS